MLNILVRSYKEEGCQPIPVIRLTDEENERARQRYTIGCSDVVIIDPASRVIYLAPRALKPKAGHWVIGGARHPNHSPAEAAAANLKRETKLDLPVDRFTLVAVLDYQCHDRQEEPQDMGCHTCAHTFTVELSADELATVTGNLEQVEYRAGAGLIPFNRARLINEKVDPAMLDLYDHIFPYS